MIPTRFLFSFLLLGFSCTSRAFETILRPNKVTKACRYKVWYLETCDPSSKSQIVHLILAQGGVNCEIAKHLTKICAPEAGQNDHPVTPENALLKSLLLSSNHTKESLRQAIKNLNTSDVPEAFVNQVSKEKVESILLHELKNYDTDRHKSQIRNGISTPSLKKLSTTILNKSSNDSRNVSVRIGLIETSSSSPVTSTITDQKPTTVKPSVSNIASLLTVNRLNRKNRSEVKNSTIPLTNSTPPSQMQTSSSFSVSSSSSTTQKWEENLLRKSLKGYDVINWIIENMPDGKQNVLLL